MEQGLSENEDGFSGDMQLSDEENGDELFDWLFPLFTMYLLSNVFRCINVK